MKTKILAIILLSLMVTSALQAEEVTLPVISKPSILEEGIQRQLSDAQIAELLPWAKDSKIFLVDLVDSIQNLTMEDKIERLDAGIKQVVQESAPKNSELLMRYILNRAIVVKEILAKEMNDDAVGTVDAKLRVLTTSISLAAKYYDTDMQTLTKKTTPDFAVFAVDYFNFLYELNKSIFDASAQYTIQKTALEWLQWDLYRDINNTRHAPKIYKINNTLKMQPSTKQSDAQYIRSIQNLKKVTTQLGITAQAGASQSSDVTTIINAVISQVEVVDGNADRYVYSTDYNKCYTRSASGEVMFGNQVSDDYCAKKKIFTYSAYYNKCYKTSHNNDIMYSSVVDSINCAKKDTFKYSVDYNKCYRVNNAEEIMYDKIMSDDNCAQPNSYEYSAYYSKCYKKGKNGEIMFSSPVEINLCAR